MSQEHHNQKGAGIIIQLYERARYMKAGTGPRLDDRQKGLIRDIWRLWAKPDLAKVGLTVMLRMFELHPCTKRLFDNLVTTKEGDERLETSSRAIFLAYRAFAIIDAVVENLDHPEEIAPLLIQVGGRHSINGYNLPPEYLGYLGEAMIDRAHAAVPSLTSEGVTALANMYEWVCDQMKDGIVRHAEVPSRV